MPAASKASSFSVAAWCAVRRAGQGRRGRLGAAFEASERLRAREMMELTLAIAGHTLFHADVRGDARAVAGLKPRAVPGIPPRLRLSGLEPFELRS